VRGLDFVYRHALSQATRARHAMGAAATLDILEEE
jgi:hypothetical protein